MWVARPKPDARGYLPVPDWMPLLRLTPQGWPPRPEGEAEKWLDFAERFQSLAVRVALHRKATGHSQGYPVLDMRDPAMNNPVNVTTAIAFLAEGWNSHTDPTGA